MIQELILIAGCITGNCKETRYTYFHYNPEQKAYVKSIESFAQRITPEYLPVVMAAARGEFTVNLNKNISLSYKNETVSGRLVYGMEY